jgi:hypothetical protein
VQLKRTRDPVAAAMRSDLAQTKATNHTLSDATPAHSFSTLMAGLDAPTFDVLTTPNAKQ